MAEFYEVNLDEEIWFTDDGLETGRPCLVDVTGVDSLSVPYAGNITESADNSPYLFRVPHGGQGARIRLEPFVASTSLLEDIKTLFAASVEDKVPIEVNISGDTGTFSLNCLPLFPKPIEFSGKFLDDNIYDLALNLVVVSQNV